MDAETPITKENIFWQLTQTIDGFKTVLNEAFISGVGIEDLLYAYYTANPGSAFSVRLQNVAMKMAAQIEENLKERIK